MLFVIYFLFKLTKEPIEGLNGIQAGDLKNEVKLNIMVTMSHISIILTYAMLSFLIDDFPYQSTDTISKLSVAYYFFTGVLVIFMAFMVWLILDKEQTPILIRDENIHISYPVLDVIMFHDDDRTESIEV